MKRTMIAGMAGLMGIALVITTSGLARAQGITLAQLAGNWSTESNSTYALCFNSTFSALVSCKGAPHVVFYIQTSIGQGIGDASGNSCFTVISTNSPEFPNPATPANTNTQIVVQKITFYNATTETGNNSFTAYNASSGTFCKGSVLVNTAKAPPAATGTGSFVVSLKGTRVDGVTDSAVDTPISSLGDDVAHIAAFRQ